MKCPHCQFENPLGMHFCGMCGTRIDGQPGRGPISLDDSSADYTPTFLKQTVLAPAQGIRGERKHVTVFFVDIVGFTTIAEQMDPESVHAIINLGSLGRLDAAWQSLRSGLKQLEGSDDQFWRSRYLNTMGWIAALQDNLNTARRLNRQPAELALKAGDMESYHNARINLGDNYLDGGQIQKTHEVLTNCWQKVSHEHAPYARWRYKTRLLINLARLYEQLDQRVKGLRYARQALSMARQNEAKVQQVLAQLVKSRLLADSQKALIRKVLLEALELSQQIHVPSLQNLVEEQLSQME